ncbi:hypothetical protein AB0537_001261 [Vibrio parahaemolyticus]
MPVLPLIYGLLAGFFAEGLIKILVKAAAIIGIGSASYLVSDYLMQSLFIETYSQFGALDNTMLSLMVILGVTEIINYLISYITILATITIIEKLT